MIKRWNKSGWIRIVEAFVAILLVTGALLIVLEKKTIPKEDISEEIYTRERVILKEIQSNDSLRDSILNISTLPVNWAGFNTANNLSNVRDKIINITPTYLICEAKICKLDDPCYLSSNLQKEIYAQAASIIANSNLYRPRQLKLFCWMKDE